MTAGENEPLDILLVEDNDAHAELVIRAMKNQQIPSRIHHVSDGKMALDYLLQQDEYADREKYPRPGLVLLDLRLPKIDGLDVLRAIKSAPGICRIPVVILTSSDAETDIARSYDLRANSYLIKPLDFPSFTRLMKDLGFYWLGWNTKPSPN